MVQLSLEGARRMIKEFNEDVAALRADPDAWEEEMRERAAWDSVLVPRGWRPRDEKPVPPWNDANLAAFGNWLVELRLRAALRSQDTVIEAARGQFPEFTSPRPLTKSMLSLYERGEVHSLKPRVLWVLGHLYGVPYEEMVRRYVNARFGVVLGPK